MRLIFAVAGCALIGLSWLWIRPVPIVESGIAKVASEEVKRAMRKMGPLKDYRILPSGKLQVKVEEKWLYLKH